MRKRSNKIYDTNNNNDQIDLFSEENYFRNVYREALSKFDLNTAEQYLKKWQRTFSPPADLSNKLQTVISLKNRMEESIEFFAHLYLNIYNMDSLNILKDDRLLLREGAAQKIYALLEPTQCEYILPELHPAEIFLSVKDYDAALACCGRYRVKNGEHPLIRLLESCAYAAKGEETSAAICATYALFDHPLKCRPDLLHLKAYAAAFEHLLQTYGKKELALLRLPFVLWKEGQTYIVPKDAAFETHLRRLIEKESNRSLRSLEEDIIHFYHLQYLAEMLRLRNGRQVISAELIEIRSKMKETATDLFAEYMNVLNSFFA